MKKLRCIGGQDDALLAYASEFLYARPASLAGALLMRDVGNLQVAVLARDGQFQVELGVLAGGTVIPAHVHPHVDTIEIGVAGAVRLMVNGVDPFAAVPDERLGRFTRSRGIRINRGDLHSGLVLPGGAMFLSVQCWSGLPSSVLEDYVGEPVSSMHRTGV